MSIWAHTLVKNEERYLWYSVASVAPFVDKVLLWDTGSTDGTLEICKKLINRFPEKIGFRQVKQESADDFTLVRQKMLEGTDADWFIVLDGDEVWWEDSIKKVTETIRQHGNSIESIVVPNFLVVGDIFHYQEKAAGMYKFSGRVGHYNQRAFKRGIPGLHSVNPHGTWGWADEEGKMVQDRDPAKIKYMEAPYLHFSFLQRAGSKGEDLAVAKRSKKLKYELGLSFPLDYYYPEVFFRDRPNIVPSPWGEMSPAFQARAILETPLRKIKRKVWGSKAGY